MKRYIEERTILVADYVIETKCTIRQAAKFFKLSKSSIHIDLSVRLPQLDTVRYRKVRKIMMDNYDERAIRGGNVTKLKFMTNNTKRRCRIC